MNIELLKQDLNKVADPEKAKFFPHFFKIGKGEYGEGDKFLGVTVPKQRKIALKYRDISFKDIQELLLSTIHEHRLTALLILVNKFKTSDEIQKKRIYDFYIKNSKRVNNWDLVDSSSPYILGNYLSDKPKNILYKFAKSNNLWEKRISIISTLYFIRNKQFNDTIKISQILLNDKHDLIHKAVGWMLREMGKRDEKILEEFLNKNYKNMPRTMLRYSIERLEKKKRDFYMKRY